MTEFSFDTIQDFDTHLELSVPNYLVLSEHINSIATYFIKDNSCVYDLGCSTGILLSKLSIQNDNAKYIGVDLSENLLGKYAIKKQNIEFVKKDIRDLEFEQNTNLVLSIFTLQFLPVHYRVSLISKIYNALNIGGALIIAEKVYLDSGQMNEIFNYSHYDYKEKSFEANQIFEKQKTLRKIMNPQTEAENLRDFKSAGFTKVCQFWQSLLFKSWLCIK